MTIEYDDILDQKLSNQRPVINRKRSGETACSA